MLRKILLFLFMGSLVASSDAQRKSQKPTTAYAITAAQKGSSSWTEVRLIDVNTGEVIKTVYTNKDEVPTLNARTRKPVAKKEVSENETMAVRELKGLKEIQGSRISTYTADESHKTNNNIVAYTFDKAIAVKVEGKSKEALEARRTKKDENTTFTLDAREITIVGRPSKVNVNTTVTTNVNTDVNTNLRTTHTVIIRRGNELLDKPFSTTSAAAAYDKKHERLYYTPIGINELRYIDLKSKTPTVYYFENEAFGALSNRHDVPNQITRMVIGGDGEGYALTNNANHLIKFTTKKGTITDLGELTDDPSNGRYSIHSSSGYGGDMVADEKDNLYLVTANRNVFKISLKTRVASYVGAIKGLPRDFSTNGAVVDEDNSIVVSSANSTLGYYKFNLESLVAEKTSAEGSVYNASDLANSNLISVKKKRDQKKEEAVKETPAAEQGPAPSETENVIESLQQNKISVYPNPVAMGGSMKVYFKDQPSGAYTVQFMDISGKLISSRQVNVSNRQQVEEYALPELTARGNYLLKVVSDAKKIVSVNKVIVQ